MIDFVPFPLLFGIAILVALLAIHRKRKYSPWYPFFFSVFWVYLLLIIEVTIFPIPMPQAWTGIATKQQAAFILSHVNLVPFSYLGFFNRYVIFQEVGRNILLTIPFGFGISFIARVRPKDLLWLSLGAGLAIEGTQLAVSLGLGGLYRTVDVTDVLVNAIGVWLGYGCFMFFSHLYLSRTRQLGIEPRGVLAYVHEVAARAQPGGAKSG